MGKFLIEAVHSRWGMVKLQAEKRTDTTLLDGVSHDYSQYVFTYSSGRFMGSWDSERGGRLGHPSEEVDKFISLYSIDLLESDIDGFRELESLIEEEILRHDPEFFSAEFKSVVRYRAPEIYEEFTALDPSGVRRLFSYNRTPDGCWIAASISHSATAIRAEVEALRKDGFEVSDSGFYSIRDLKSQLRARGYTDPDIRRS